MNLTHNIFLFLLFALNYSALFSSEGPVLKKSGALAIPIIAFQPPSEAHSLENFSSILNTKSNSGDITPESVSPTRRYMAELKDATQKTISALKRTQSKTQFQKQLENKLMEVALMVQSEMDKSEEKLAVENLYFESPCSGKVCSLEELKAIQYTQCLSVIDCP